MTADVDYSIAEDGTLLLGPRRIPLPTSIGDAARKCLASPIPARPQPPVEDKAAWSAMVAAFDKMFDPMADRWLTSLPVSTDTCSMNGVTVYVAVPNEIRHPGRVHFRVHGGGFVLMGGKAAKGEAALFATQLGCITFGLDYRMPPQHPYPAAVDDAVAVWRELIEIHAPTDIVVSGSSAGGNIAAAAILKARDTGLPLPGALALLTPSVDLTRSGDSIQTNAGVDTVLHRSTGTVELYADGHDLKNPYLSPLFGDFGGGFPPTFLQSGTRDLLLSDTVRMHRALLNAGIGAELHVWEAMPHGGFGVTGTSTPEDREVVAALANFIDRKLS